MNQGNNHSRTILRPFLMIGIVLSLLMLTACPQVTPQPPVFLTFVKSAAEEGIWEGTVSGDITGDLRTELLSLDDAEPVWQVEFDWIISADDPNRSFVARLSGTLNTETGAVTMSGTVISGYLQGALVQEQGQLMDADTFTFAGVIQIIP